MALKFLKLTRPAIKALKPGQSINEHGITFERLSNGDGRWLVNIMVNGKRIHRLIGKESEGYTRLKCEEAIEKWRSESRTGKLKLSSGRQAPLLFPMAAKRYQERLKESGGKDLKSKKHRLRDHLVPHFAKKELSEICTMDVERYKKQRVDAKAKPGSINRELAVLSHMLNKALEWGWITAKPCAIRRLSEDSGRITYLTLKQIESLLKAAEADKDPDIHLFIRVGLGSGMRLSEILSIRIENVSTERREIYIPKAKAGARTQPILKSLADYLAEHLTSLPENQIWLFPTRARDASKTGHRVNIVDAFERVIKAAGLAPDDGETKQERSAKVVRHTLRHTYITHLVQQGVDLPTVKRLSGHKTLQMVERYSHQSGAHLQAAMDKLDEAYNAKEQEKEQVKEEKPNLKVVGK